MSAAASPPAVRIGTALDPYGQLIKMLMPRAQTISVYGQRGQPLWCSEGQDDPDLHELGTTALNTDANGSSEIDGFARTLDGATAYAFRLRDNGGVPLAVATLMTRDSGDSRPFTLVLGLLRPALECLQREIVMRASLGTLSRDLSSRDRDLELLLDLGNDDKAKGVDGDELARLMQVAVDHLQCSLGALIIPEKNLAVVRGPTGQKADASVLARTHRHLMAWAQLQRRTMVVNRIAAGPGMEKVPPFKIVCVPVRHQSNRVIGFLAVFNPLTAPDFEQRHTRIVELLARKVTAMLLANFDANTGLLTRSAFEQQVNVILDGATDATGHAVLYLDIDRLHVINENFGMNVGDEVIAKIAELVRRRAPSSAVSARIAGDRMVLFLPRTAIDEATKLAEDLCAAARELSQQRPEGLVTVSLSAGIAVLPGSSRHPLQHGLASAEIACKTAKDRGRDRVEVFEEADQSILRRNADVQLATALRDALARDRFELVAQPILPLGANGGAPRFEIFLRLISDTGERLPPAKFMQAADRFQLMPAIDQWVVEHTLAELARHRSLLKSQVASFAINLSAPSLTQSEFAELIERQIAASAIPPDTLCFEINEAVAVANLERATLFMQRLRSLGCQFALDDFGLGTSSLAYLKTLPASVLKIDGTFVRDSLVNPRSESMVKAFAQLAHTMGMQTVAENVESDELRIRMANLGVDFGQGFAVGRPLPLIDVLQDLSLYEVLAAEQAALGASLSTSTRH